MGEDFRERFFIPFVLPVTAIGVMLLIGISLARVLMAISAINAALLALLAAGYIMAMAFLIESRRRITPRAVGVGLAVGLAGLLASGAVASAAGMRPLEKHGAAEEGEGAESIASPDLPPGEVFVAQDIFYAEAPEVVPTGEQTWVIDNQGTIVHNIVVEELGDELIAEAEGGEVATGTVTLDEGEYVYYCDIPGHREAGMEGTLTASATAESADEGAEAGGAAEGATEEGATDDGAEAGTDTESEPADTEV